MPEQFYNIFLGRRCKRGARMHNYVFEIDVQNWQLEGKNQSITTNEGTDGAKHKICSKNMIPNYISNRICGVLLARKHMPTSR